jgi:hypothetical protein
MNNIEKEGLIAEIAAILQAKIKADTSVETQPKLHQSQMVEMLTVKECTEVVKGISDHTLRLLIQQNKIPHIRTGEGKNGKILVSKTALFNYFNKI